MTLVHAVTVAFDEPGPPAAAAARLRLQRTAARACLRSSRVFAGAPPGRPRRDAAGAPRPSGSWHWSTTATRGRAAAAAAPARVGVDCERLDRRDSPALRETPSADERRLLCLLGGGGRRERLRLWTAKEAVLKKLGCGLSRFSRCRLAEVPRTLPDGARAWSIELDGRRHRVVQRDVGEHSLAVSADLEGDWSVAFGAPELAGVRA